jgi:transposase
MNRANEARNAEIIRLRQEGVGPREIARLLKVTPQTVAGVLFRGGLTKPTAGRGNGPTPEFVRLVLSELSRSSWRQTAAKFGVSTTTIGNWLHLLTEAA